MHLVGLYTYYKVMHGSYGIKLVRDSTLLVSRVKPLFLSSSPSLFIKHIFKLTYSVISVRPFENVYAAQSNRVIESRY